MTRWCIIGPTYPFRGGIAHHTTLLTQHLRQADDTLLISFTRQYPRWLYPGRSDRDPSLNPLATEVEYLLDPVNPLSWRRTVRRLNEWQPEGVIMPWWVPFWAPAWAYIGRQIKGQKSAPKLIFICHNVLPHEGRIIDKIALRLALVSGDGYIVHSKSDADNLKAQFPGANVRVTPLPTYAALGKDSTANCPASLPDDRPLLLFFGFIRPYKGLDILLEALTQVSQPVHLLVAGEFWENQEKYDDLVLKLDLGDRVTLVNKYLTDEALAACMARAEVAVLPYRSATQSAVIQAAFGHGLPVITTDVGGLAEVVEDGRTGLIVPVQDPGALAAAIDQFIGQDLGPQFREHIQQNQEHFSWQRLIDLIGELSDDQEDNDTDSSSN